MARKQKMADEFAIDIDSDDFTNRLIKDLNAEHGNGEKICYNLEFDDAPTKIHRWISTGSKQLDYIISNQNNGGLPEGRIIEIFGPPSIGKSHIAAQIAKSTQQLNGIVVYVDSENATSTENLKMLGVNIAKNFIYAEASCTEKVFELAESIIIKTKSLKKDVPVTIIWDSVAATSPKAEIEGDYDKMTVGLQARALSKGFRKITNVIGFNRVTFVCLNQTRTDIGMMFGDNQVPSGGKAIPFHASVRIKLSSGQHIKLQNGEVIGINVTAKTIKNKVSPPFRSCSFQIVFGVGIKEHEELFDFLKEQGKVVIDNMSMELTGNGAHKQFTVVDTQTNQVLHSKRFFKRGFDVEVLKDVESKKFIDKMIDACFVRKMTSDSGVNIDDESLVEIQAITDAVEGMVEPE